MTGPRIIVVGTSGAGKTTLAAAIADRVDIPHVEIDGLAHGPDWTMREEFVADVEAFAATDAWVTEWQYTAVRAILAARATAAVWLDYPLWLRMGRNVRRTIRRRTRREVLWNGNIEPPLWTFFTDPDHVTRYAWRGRKKYDDLPDRLAAMGRADLPIVRLRTQAETDQWLATLPAGLPGVG